jgi:hypothetical protein
MLIYTTEEGGFFKGLVDGQGQIRTFSESEYEQLKKTRLLDTEERGFVRPVLIALARIEDHHDFVLGGPREKKED